MSALDQARAALKAATRGSNELDVLVAVATFKPDDLSAPRADGDVFPAVAIRANHAGTKIIVTYLRDDGHRTEVTHWAYDFTSAEADASRLLAETAPGSEVSLHSDHGTGDVPTVLVNGGVGAVVTARGATLPLAYCAAAVEVRWRAEQTVEIAGQTYRRFKDPADREDDGTTRCVFCGQVDEPEWHEPEHCPAFATDLPS